MMKKKVFIPIISVISSFIALGFFFTNLLMFMRKKEDSFIQEREIKAGRLNLDDFHSLPKIQINIPSSYGYNLNCLFVTPHASSNKWMIFCHGVTENKYNSIKYMNIFLKRGFNAIIYDHRRHGLSGGKTSSYGFYEKYDLEAVVHELKRREGNDVMFGIHGESMGAATALLYGGSIQDDAAFYIVDCPFSTFYEQVKHRMKFETSLPSWLVLPIGNLFLKIRDGYHFQDVSPLEAVKNISKPVLFIHSEHDDFIPASMSKQLFDAKKDNKQFFLATKGGHAQSLNENPKEYEKAIDTFLDSFPI